MDELLYPYMDFVHKESAKSVELFKMEPIICLKFYHVFYYVPHFLYEDRSLSCQLVYQSREILCHVSQAIVCFWVVNLLICGQVKVVRQQPTIFACSSTQS